MCRADENTSPVVVKGQRLDSHEAVKSPDVAASSKVFQTLTAELSRSRTMLNQALVPDAGVIKAIPDIPLCDRDRESICIL